MVAYASATCTPSGVAVAVKVLVDNRPNSHSGRSQTTGVLLQCKFCPVAILRVLITAVIGTLVYGTNTLHV